MTAEEAIQGGDRELKGVHYPTPIYVSSSLTDSPLTQGVL